MSYTWLRLRCLCENAVPYCRAVVASQMKCCFRAKRIEISLFSFVFKKLDVNSHRLEQWLFQLVGFHKLKNPPVRVGYREEGLSCVRRDIEGIAITNPLVLQATKARRTCFITLDAPDSENESRYQLFFLNNISADLVECLPTTFASRLSLRLACSCLLHFNLKLLVSSRVQHLDVNDAGIGTNEVFGLHHHGSRHLKPWTAQT